MPAVRTEMSPSALEHELQRQLNPSRTTAPDKGIAFSHVARGSGRQEALARTGVWIDPNGVTGGKEGRQEWIGKIRMIHDVEEICPKLHFQPVAYRCVLI